MNAIDLPDRLQADRISMHICLDDLPSVPWRNHIRHKLFGNWLRRLWWMHIAKRVIPRRHEWEMFLLWNAEALVRQELIDVVITKAQAL